MSVQFINYASVELMLSTLASDFHSAAVVFHNVHSVFFLESMLKWAFNPVLRCGKKLKSRGITLFSERPAGWEEKRSSISRGDALQKSGEYFSQQKEL